MINYTWASHALRCAAARNRELRPVEHYSWAQLRQQRERLTLSALYDHYWAGIRREFETAYGS